MSISIVMGSGGHTSELISILSSLPLSHQERIGTVFYGQDDGLSVEKLTSTISHTKDENVEFVAIHRARRVGQSYMTAIFSSLLCLLQATKAAFYSKTSMIICNGPAICVMVVLAHYIVHMLQLGLRPRPKVLYIESVTRVKRLSLTGRLMLVLADEILVQWPQLKDLYNDPKVSYAGLLV